MGWIIGGVVLFVVFMVALGTSNDSSWNDPF